MFFCCLQAYTQTFAYYLLSTQTDRKSLVTVCSVLERVSIALGTNFITANNYNSNDFILQLSCAP